MSEPKKDKISELGPLSDAIAEFAIRKRQVETKPEAPAPEPQRKNCAVCSLMARDGRDVFAPSAWEQYERTGCFPIHRVPATAAPSQPAREFYANDYQKVCNTHTDYMDFAAAYSAQQSAAKDAEIAELKRDFHALDNILDEEHVARSCINPFEDLRNVCRSLVAAERERDNEREERDAWQAKSAEQSMEFAKVKRERDSLRDALRQADGYLAVTNIPDARSTIAEALKAGKDGQQ